ncbi:beta-lactamase family protein [Brachybacterium sp. EF45031]|uniref:serine hydrolase domain-containing protein n=1 Tax=Brachybacterium sillae TaxID=2810536 RepID=UPI00217F017F|nr:serine hydrolase domain-containing protein [Brachybacterium sillae]MCS6712663.1 beta-lactamase family protein [Brachybacterium sillae]
MTDLSRPSLGRTLPREAVDSAGAILEDWLATVVRTRSLTGIQAAIWHEGELVTEVAVGTADLTADIPLRTTHRLRIASHSKMFCAMTVMRLVEDGRLRLDDTVADHVPQLADAPVADRTVRDLLSHSAGVTRDSADSRWWQLATRFPDREALIELCRGPIVLTAAGDHFQYSNIGYGLLGLIIEAVSGATFAEAVQRLVLDPLGVEAVGPDLPVDAPGPADPAGFAAGHTTPVHGPRRTVAQIPTGALAAATGFWATAGSIATAVGRVLCDGEVLQPRSVREMRRRVWTVREGGHYGLGLQEGTFHGFGVIGHSGGFPTGLSRTWVVPESRLVVSVIGTAPDAPASDLAAGILGLLALAHGAPAPGAESHEGPAAQGGAGAGRPRPAPLADQPPVRIGDDEIPARRVAQAIAGTYDSLWGRTRLAILGDRLFDLGAAALDPADGAVELAVAGTTPDPIQDGTDCVRLATWGDAGYGSWAEDVLARWEDGRCTGIIDTGQLAVPSEEYTLPEHIDAP